MTTTPTVWKEKFTVNPNGTAGDQRDIETVGLANGSFVTIWTDDTAGAGAGRDIMCQRFDPLGNPIGSAFQLNRASTAGDESRPEIVALPTGGFVVAYGSAERDNHSIFVERFNDAGNPVSSREIRDTSDPLATWRIAANDDGDYIVGFNQSVDEDNVDVRAFVFDNATNAGSTKHLFTTQNSDEGDYIRGLDTFSNGDIISISVDIDSPGLLSLAISTAEFRITSESGQPIGSFVQVSGAGDNDSADANDVAVLTNDRFVVLYQYDGFGRQAELVLRVGTRDGASTTTTDEITVTTSFRGLESSISRVVALQDGGFLVAWVEGITLRGTRYDNDGDVVGQAGFTIATSLSIEPYPLGDMSLTDDGRVLVAFRNSEEELSQVIVDPRDNVIFGTEGNDVLTTQTTTTVLIAGGGNDVVYGQAGNDILSGEAGRDALYGGGGGDSLDGGTDRDVLYGGSGDDTYLLRDVIVEEPVIGRAPPGTPKTYRYDSAVENAGEGIDSVRVRAATASDGHVVTSYRLAAQIENGTVEGTAAFTLIGNELANSLVGNSGSNTLDGGAGSDTLTGGAGTDHLYGGAGADHLYGGAGADRLIGGEDRDYARYDDAAWGDIVIRLDGGAGTGPAAGDTYSSIEGVIGGNGNDTIFGSVGDNHLIGGYGNDFFSGNTGNDTIQGGPGADRIRFSTAPSATNVDTLVGFEHGVDKIELSRSIFASIGPTLTADEFGPAADPNNFIIYQQSTGRLLYDAGGSGSSPAPILFATVAAGTVLDVGDFTMI